MVAEYSVYVSSLWAGQIIVLRQFVTQILMSLLETVVPAYMLCIYQ